MLFTTLEVAGTSWSRPLDEIIILNTAVSSLVRSLSTYMDINIHKDINSKLFNCIYSCWL